ncbi:MAG: DUF92 domain-containing protein [Calditrichaeota bacterium]|nr:MAG: DUF92 domain-containing protein [Calditrichota bacterium]
MIEIQSQSLLTGIFLSAGLAFLASRFRLLTFSGSIATFFMGTIILGFGGWAWAVPILVFFLPSSLLSRIGKTRKEKLKDIVEKGGQRDALQVLANGGVATGILLIHLFHPSPTNYGSYLCALSAAAADTWATELGALSPNPPRLITNGKRVPPGTSGAVTLLGVLASLAGASSITLSGIYFLSIFQLNVWITNIVVIFSGVFGSLMDSLLGATLQGQYQCPHCMATTEKHLHCGGTPTSLTKGYSWMTNDVVNFINTLSGAVIGWGLLFLAFRL